MSSNFLESSIRFFKSLLSCSLNELEFSIDSSFDGLQLFHGESAVFVDDGGLQLEVKDLRGLVESVVDDDVADGGVGVTLSRHGHVVRAGNQQAVEIAIGR